MTPRVLSIILLVCAVGCAVVLTGLGLHCWTTDHPFGWLGACLALGFASFLPEK
jgi:hypothetical protein